MESKKQEPSLKKSRINPGPSSGKADMLYFPNIRSGLRHAVAEAYLHWCDVSEAEAMDILEEMNR